LKETVFLNNDREMPLLGLGVYKLPDDVQAEAAVTSAISAGYRMIDTASVYKNEESVGRAIAKCGVPRKDLFITSKIWNNAQRLGDVQGAFSRSLDRLKVSYVDLYLIHWPVPGCYLSTWKELESILESGRALSIGVSNFDIRHLEELRKISGVIPAVNQIECHPLCYPAELIEYCKALNRLKSSLKPVTLKRQGMGYHDTLTAASSAHAVSADISGKNLSFASASAIRELLTSTLTQETIAQISAQVPDEASAFFVSSLRNNGYLSEEVLDDLLVYRIMYEDAESLSQYLDVSENLAERIINCRNEISGFTQAASLLKTKELTQTRIQRALLHSILQIREAPLSVPYSRVLGFRKESSPLLKEIKKNSTLPVLTKLADSDALLDETGKRLLSETTAASNLYEKLLCKKNGQKFIHEYQKQIVIL
jgi:diketogulonate reductase-like aldo/keto reductase